MAMRKNDKSAAVLHAAPEMNIKNRKISLHRIRVPLGHRSLRIIHVTDKQLARLNRIPVGKEFFLGSRECQIGGGYWVIRTKGSLQYIPNPYDGTEDDIRILEAMLS
jgi:hypothetical protein